jgi:hypothetical protein
MALVKSYRAFFPAELVFAKGRATVCERTWHLVGNSRWAPCLTGYNVCVSRRHPRIWECISSGDLISRRYRIFQDTRIDFLRFSYLRTHENANRLRPKHLSLKHFPIHHESIPSVTEKSLPPHRCRVHNNLIGLCRVLHTCFQL